MVRDLKEFFIANLNDPYVKKNITCTRDMVFHLFLKFITKLFTRQWNHSVRQSGSQKIVVAILQATYLFGLNSRCISCSPSHHTCTKLSKQFCASRWSSNFPVYAIHFCFKAGPQWKTISEPMVIIVRDPQIETRFNGMKQFTVYVVETKVRHAFCILYSSSYHVCCL